LHEFSIPFCIAENYFKWTKIINGITFPAYSNSEDKNDHTAGKDQQIRNAIAPQIYRRSGEGEGKKNQQHRNAHRDTP
jgi:hypothetical protein